jgi:hypothetical protein
VIDETRGEDAFAERIAKPLRASERADATFEARAMSAVHAAARADAGESRLPSPSWWLRPYTLRLTPLTALAAAASLTIAVLGGSSLVRRQGAPATAAATRDTVHIVRFVLVDSNARRVALVGAFNQWQKDATPLHGTSVGGVWFVDVPLSSGRHEYAFVVYDEHGERWVADPLSHVVRDEYGTESSVISVGRTT